MKTIPGTCHCNYFIKKENYDHVEKKGLSSEVTVPGEAVAQVAVFTCMAVVSRT